MDLVNWVQYRHTHTHTHTHTYIYIYIYIHRYNNITYTHTHTHTYIYIYNSLNTLSIGKSCLVAPGVAVLPWATETVLSPLVGGWWGQGIARAFTRMMKEKKKNIYIYIRCPFWLYSLYPIRSDEVQLNLELLIHINTCSRMEINLWALFGQVFFFLKEDLNIWSLINLIALSELFLTPDWLDWRIYIYIYIYIYK